MNNYEQTLSSHCPHSLRGRHQNPNGNFRDPARNRLGLYTDMPLKYRNRDLYAIYLYLYAYIYMYDICIYIYIISHELMTYLSFSGLSLISRWRQADAQRLPHGFARGLEGVFEKWLMCVCVCFSECVYVYIMFQIDIQCYMCI